MERPGPRRKQKSEDQPRTKMFLEASTCCWAGGFPEASRHVGILLTWGFARATARVDSDRVPRVAKTWRYHPVCENMVATRLQDCAANENDMVPSKPSP